MQSIFPKENADKALKYRLYRHLPAYEKIIRNLVSFLAEKYKLSEIQELSHFAEGLEKDIEAVENSVASPLSNGFVEGTNNKLKMVKRTMYGRCSRQLLEAKLMYRSNV